MSRFQLDLAGPADDAELRSALARTPMDGRIGVTFRREPSYFGASVVDGRFRQVVVGRDRAAAGAIVGLGSRSIREAYVNGVPESVGYLSGLRLLPEYRRWGAVAVRGFRFFRELHADARTRLYLTTIAEGNARALAFLTRGGAGMPAYHFAGLYHTAAIPLRRRRRGVALQPGEERRYADAGLEGVTLRRASPEDLPLLVDFLRGEGARRQFFPIPEARDFFDLEGAFRDLDCGDILLAVRDGALVGTLGAWDQHGFRQSVVNAYAAGLRAARPFYNVVARALDRPRLPAPGEAFHCLTAALPVVAGDDERVFDLLLRSLLEDKAGGAAEYFLLGLHEADPLLRVMRRLRGTTWYTTRLYHVCWEDGEEFRRALDARVPYLELGSL